MQRPTSVTVFGILNLVFGGFGLLITAVQAIALFLVNPQPGQVDPMLDANSLWGMWTRVSIVLSVAMVTLLILSGIGLLTWRPWGRSLAIGYAVFGIVVGIVSILMPLSLFAQPAFEDLKARGGPEAVGMMAGVVGGAMVGGCIRLIYPALLWYYMTRPRVIAAFSGLPLETLQPSWPPESEPFAPVESDNPYLPPRIVGMPPAPSGGISESIVETLVPSRNGPALASYYLGVFSLIPCLGLPMGVAAISYGIAGLRRERENPAVRGGAHAWVGIICGSLFGLLNLLGLVLALIAFIAGAANR